MVFILPKASPKLELSAQYHSCALRFLTPFPSFHTIIAPTSALSVLRCMLTMFVLSRSPTPELAATSPLPSSEGCIPRCYLQPPRTRHECQCQNTNAEPTRAPPLAEGCGLTLTSRKCLELKTNPSNPLRTSLHEPLPSPSH